MSNHPLKVINWRLITGDYAMSDTIVHTTDGGFDQDVLNSEKPVLVDYWAEWCGPCKMVAPILEEVAQDLDGKLLIGKVDVDQNKDSALKQKVMSIPTLVLFKNGEPIDQRIGALTKTQLEDFLNQHI